MDFKKSSNALALNAPTFREEIRLSSSSTLASSLETSLPFCKPIGTSVTSKSNISTALDCGKTASSSRGHPGAPVAAAAAAEEAAGMDRRIRMEAEHILRGC